MDSKLPHKTNVSMNSSAKSQENDILHPQIPNDGIDQTSELHSISNISDRPKSEFLSNYQEIIDMRLCTNHPENKANYIRLDTKSLICSICVAEFASRNYPIKGIDIMQEKCVAKRHLLEKIIKGCKQTKEQMVKTLKDDRQTLEEVVTDTFSTKMSRLKKIEERILSQIKKSTLIDQERLKEIDEKLISLEQDCENRNLNIKNMSLDDKFIMDYQKDIPTQSILSSLKALIGNNALKLMHSKAKDLLNEVEEAFDGIEKNIKATLRLVEIDQLKVRENEKKEDKVIDWMVGSISKKTNKDLEEKLKFIEMNNYISFEQIQDRLLLKLEDCRQQNNSTNDRWLVSNQKLAICSNEYHKLKMDNSVDRSDVLSGVDYLVEGLGKIQEIDYMFDLKSIIEENQDLLIMLNYPFGNTTKILKTLEVDVPSSQYPCYANSIKSVKQFLDPCKEIDQVIFKIRTFQYSDEMMKRLIEDAFSVSEKFSKLGLRLIFTNETKSILSALLIIVALMNSSQVFFSDIQETRSGLYLCFKLKKYFSVSRELAVFCELEGVDISDQVRRDLIRAIVEVVSPQYLPNLEKKLLKKNGFKLIIEDLKITNIFGRH